MGIAMILAPNKEGKADHDERQDKGLSNHFISYCNGEDNAKT
jgi:hypothetical protein